MHTSIEASVTSQSIPADLSASLIHLHSNPAVWWTAQFVHYLMRPQAELHQQMKKAELALGDTDGLIVGIHVRRTDKVGAEAAFHDITEYMLWAERWFVQQEMFLNRTLPRRAYLATDDRDLLKQSRQK